MSETPADEASGLPSAERLKTFTDAVVAIAMTLLILPLMSSVAETPDASTTVADWIMDEGGGIITFALSFVLIANFWLGHHRLFSRVHRVTTTLLWLTIAWMFTIVWLPVATALLTRFEVEPLQEILYIGSLALTSLVMVVTSVYVLRHPALHSVDDERMREGLAGGIAVSVLFLLALVIALLLPVIAYASLWILFLSPLLQRAIAPLTRSRGRRPS